MKLKNVKPIEKHLEKAILGITVVFALFIAYMYLLGNPHEVNLGQQTVGPDEVEDLIFDQAKRLDMALGSEKPSPQLDVNIPNYTENFAGRHRTLLMSQPRFMAMNVPAKIGRIDRDVTDRPFAVPQVPSPRVVAAEAELGTLAFEQVQQQAELIEAIGPEPPFDVAWVSLLGQFNMAQMLEELTKDTGDAEPLPDEWWRNTFALADIVVEREEWVDGQWTNRGVLPPLPGRVELREFLDAEDPQQAVEVLRQVFENQAEIVQPEFYQLASGVWEPPLAPSEQEELLDEDGLTEMEQIQKLQKKIQRKQLEVQQWQTRIEKLRNRGSTRSRPRERAEPQMGPEGMMPPDIGGRASQRTTTRRPSTRTELLEQRLQKARNELQELREQLQELTGQDGATRPRAGERQRTTMPDLPAGGYGAEEMWSGGMMPPGAEGMPMGPDMQRGGRGDRERGDRALFLSMETVDLWGHDLQAEPGKVYRYRMKVRVINPLYRQERLPEEQREQYAGQFTLESDWSDWSEPVEVPKMQHFFLTSSASNMRQGTIEAWKYVNGAWQRAEFRVSPGDPIGRPRDLEVEYGRQAVTVDFFTGNYVVDFDFNYLVPAQFGGLSRKTTRMLFFNIDGREMGVRVLDEDRRNPLREELEVRQQMAAGADMR